MNEEDAELYKKPLGIYDLPNSRSGFVPHNIQPVSSDNQNATTSTSTNATPVLLGKEPMSRRCPKCNQDITTKIVYDVGVCAVLICTLFCITGCFPCIAVPFVINYFKDCQHYCPTCNHYFGMHAALVDYI